MVGIGSVVVYHILLVVGFFRMFSRCLALISYISLEVARRLLATWLGVWMLSICSNSAPVMFWTYDSTMSVVSLAWLASKASFGQCCYVVATRCVCVG